MLSVEACALIIYVLYVFGARKTNSKPKQEFSINIEEKKQNNSRKSAIIFGKLESP